MNEVEQEAEAEDARSKLQSAILNKVIRNRYAKANQQYRNYNKLKNTQNKIAINQFSTAARNKKNKKAHVAAVKNEAANYI